MPTTYNETAIPNSASAAGNWGQTSGYTFLSALQYNDSGHALHDASLTGDSGGIYFALPGSIPTYVTINYCYFFGTFGFPQNYKAGDIICSSGASVALYGNVAQGTGWNFYAYTRPGGGAWLRSDLSGMYLYLRSAGQGTPTPVFSVGYANVTVNWQYIQLSPSLSAATNIGALTARLNGSCSQNGDAGAQRYFEWGTSSGNYSLGNSGWASVNGSTYYDATGLPAGTTIYFRMRAKNSGGEEFYTSELSFKTLSGGCLILID